MKKIFKEFLIFIFVIFISSGVGFCKQLKFVQVTDNHLSVTGKTDSSRDVSNSVSILKEAVSLINQMSDISFVMFSGDNIDQSNEDNLKAFCEITKNLKKPYYVALGNHDAYKVGGIDKDKYFKIVKEYDKYQKNEKPSYFFFPDKDFIVIVVDGSTQIIPSSHGNFLDGTLSWLDNTLTKYSNKKAIIIQHFPLVEPYENKSHRVLYPEKYFDVLKKHNNVFAIFSGHYHGGGIHFVDGIYHVSTPALIQKPYGFRLVEINYDESSIFKKDLKPEMKTKVIYLEKPEGDENSVE